MNIITVSRYKDSGEGTINGYRTEAGATLDQYRTVLEQHWKIVETTADMLANNGTKWRRRTEVDTAHQLDYYTRN